MPAKTHAEGQQLAQALYLRARKNVLARVKAASERIDALHQADAEAIKKGLRDAFALRGVPNKRIAKIIDEALASSRPERLAAIEDAIVSAAKEAAKLDEGTFRAVFGDPEAAGPFPVSPSGSRPIAMPSLRLVSRSEDDSPEMD